MATCDACAQAGRLVYEGAGHVQQGSVETWGDLSVYLAGMAERPVAASASYAVLI